MNAFIKCQTCGKFKNNNSQDFIYIKKNSQLIYFHKNCLTKYTQQKYNGSNIEINTSKNINGEEEKIIMYEQLKKFSEIISISNNEKNYKSDILKKYHQNCLQKFKYFNKVFDIKIRLDEIENIKEEFAEENYEKLKKKIIEKENQIYEDLLKDTKKYEEKSKEWEQKWRKKINNYIIDSNIKKYIKIKACQLVKNGNQNGPNKLTDWKIEYEYIENIHKENYINLYEIKPKKDSSNLMLIFSRELGPENSIENYFSSHNNGLIIGKERDVLKINFKNKKIEAYKGLYDFDKISDTLILYREEEKEKKLGIYSKEEKSKTINCNQYVLDNSIINQIMLVPCYQAYENQSFLLFVDKEIHMIQINNENEFPKIINLDREFSYKNFKEFRFIVHFDFLLILHYNIQEKKWKGKVFSLCLEDDSFFNFIREIELDEENNRAKFSLAEIKEKKYLLSIKIIGNIPIVNYWEINARLSGISSDYQKKHKKQINNDISLGNCVINYFYHCFEKYPLLSALHYKFQKYDKKSIKLYFYLKDDLSDSISSLEKYIEELKKCFEKKKKTSFHDINFSFKQNFSSFFIKKFTSLGFLIVNLLEVTPIQIAKIMEHEFKILSDGENIEKKLYIESQKKIELHKKAKFNIKNYSKAINFCMKDSIFNFFELPVVVICCFGTQSIGKSTFLNELTGSLFDVSGKRCTEGIWMSVKLYLHNIVKNEKRKCKNLCENCSKKNCQQLIHEEIKSCLCNDCLCGKDCFFNEKDSSKSHTRCFKKCCLKKGHELNIKCSFNNCQCNCVCDCICSKFKTPHNHLCNYCSIKHIDNCECECNCKHFCGVPIFMHNFICVCLDFEGLGTFERTNEQDIQMALVGSALGNSIIFRTGNTFDKFTENTLEKLALGSNKIKDINIEQYFGGSLFFSPRDVNSTDKDKLREEFAQKIENSVKKWNYSLINSSNKENKLKNNKYTIFGIFEDNVFAPTPIYPDISFYKTLRENLTKEIIENTIKFKRSPKYRTGKEFYSNLKLFLSAVYMNEYEFLTNYKEKLISEYIYENIDKAYEICAILKMNETPEDSLSFIEQNPIKYYIKKDYLEELGIDFMSYNKFHINNSLIIDNIKISSNIQGNYKSDKYEIQINVNKVDYDNFTISLENFKDSGLILLIFNEIKESVTYEKLCSNLFDIWDNICKEIGLNDKMIIEFFNLFIASIINRRIENVKNWLKEITKTHENLKELRNQYSLINNIWILCRQQCKYCFYNCCFLQGHQGEHLCPYNHKCKEICGLCINSKCLEENCEHNCTEKAGHPEEHTCNHIHQCNENCIFMDYTNDCKGKCILKLGHENNHYCGLENHHCNANCDLYIKANNCKGKCILSYPHEGKEHDCGERHYCKSDCSLKDKTEGCNGYCNLEYGHEGNHYCGKDHICIAKCCLIDKAKNCSGKCILTYQHEGKMHNCGQIHYCLNECSLVNESYGCNKNCNLIYGHEGNHNCGKTHFCIADCSLISCSLGCGKKCGLEYPHEGKEHICKSEHYCPKICQFSNLAKECHKNCVLKYNHIEACICSLSKEQHICNKKCFNCSKDCNLIAGHGDQCFCGNCKCPKSCKFENCTRGCQKNCKYIAGHKEIHICNSKHYCKKECWLKNYSKNCQEFCCQEITESIESLEHTYHICNIPLEKHGCNGTCIHYNDSRNCKQFCSRQVNHSGDHLCEVKIEQHLCKYQCDLNNYSQNCMKICNLPFNHKGNHICSLDKDSHLCNNKCSLFSLSRSGCKENCNLIARHSGNCICKNSLKMHLCNEICDLYDKTKGCKKLCNLISGHKGEHQCEIRRDEHKCKGICFLKGKTRGKCYENCCLPYGHKDNCNCKKNTEHLCNKECSLYNNAKNCKRYCNKPFGHLDEHLCDEISIHKCPNKCFYFGKCKGSCKENCMLPYGHKEKCICINPNYINYHLCNKICLYFGNSRGCNKECSKKYGHDGDCICNVKDIFHFCMKKCELCTTECGHVFNHENKSDLKCYKCKDKTCCLTRKNHHVCGAQHNCKEKCQLKGCCEIQSFVQLEEKTYTNNFGETIPYKATKSQEVKKNNCCIKIKENEITHPFFHICEEKVHKCGYQCPQCDYYCTEDQGHEGLHNCFHGNIKNSYISVSGVNQITIIRKENKEYHFKQGEKPIVFVCDGYCKEQGQGHIHQFTSIYEKIIENENVRLVPGKEHLYECKCSYFWEKILKFKGKFTTDEEKKFAMCNWTCKYTSHQSPEYCQLPLWHKKSEIIPSGLYGKWLYEGHIFKCYHPIAVYSIFLIDQSGSMKSKSEKPTGMKIKNRLDNILGVSIQAIDNFCRIRSQNNKKDKCSIIGFENEAKVILSNIYMEDKENIINTCLEKLNPDGGTNFYCAFKESSKILDIIDRNEFIPIIILLSDGIDHSYKSTKNFLEKVSKYFIIYFCR